MENYSLNFDLPLPEATSRNYDTIFNYGLLAKEDPALTWTEVRLSPSVSIYKKMLEGDNIYTIRISAIVENRTPESLLVAFQDKDVRLSWDKDLTVFETLETNQEEGYIINRFVKQPPAFFVDPREQILRVAYELNIGENKGIYAIAESVEHEKAPITNTIVRAKARILLFLERLSEDPLKTRLFLVNHVDPCGNLPSFLVNNLIDSVSVEMINKLYVASKEIANCKEKYENVVSFNS